MDKMKLVICPYCGSRMHMLTERQYGGYSAFCQCIRCQAQSPYIPASSMRGADESKRLAYAAAMKRCEGGAEM